ncbi:MAG: phenylalanine--tRNA ligase subunit alpha [Actinobacteria bacterium]|nr:phenylalanine--tRNA ligase subunit alpha [Actinomycetota bacterium]
MSDNAQTSPEITPEAVETAVEAALAAIGSAADTAELKAARAAHVAEGSPLAILNASMRQVAPEHKAAFGKLIGQGRGRVTQALAAKEAELAEAETAARLEAERVDMTAVASRSRVGARHPLTLLQDQISDVFVGMGWEIAEGPELEHEWFNFDALNFDVDHPARQEQDTFYVDPPSRHLVMRTHTSPVQVRSMLDREVPIYVLCPGRVYRTDEFDATHLPVFTQFEGLVVDKGISMAHLKGTLDHVARQLFGPEAKTRFRTNFFPFTEPSAELDLWHPTFKGGARWIEWGGCGMVNPRVLRAAGIDPDRYSGFAFGIGIERTLMFRHDVTDMREMVEGDVRFTTQFGMEV